MERLGDPTMAATAIDLAINTPIDLVTAGATGGQFLVEDVHPGWRLPRIVAAMEQEFWVPEAASQACYVQKVMDRAGLCQPRELAELVMKGPLNGDRSWSMDGKLLNRPGTAPLEVFVGYVEAEFRQNAASRLSDPLHMLSAIDSAGSLHRPPLEFYADRAALFITPVTTQLARPDLHRLLYMFTVVSDAALAFLGDEGASDALCYEKSFVAGVQALNKPKASAVFTRDSPSLSARAIVRSSLGRQGCSTLSTELP